MSAPRPGGETAKFGERYEGVWSVRRLLDVLRGHAVSLTVEPIDEELGAGVEFAFDVGDEVQVHQVKRQLSGASNWSISDLASRGVLTAALAHSERGRSFYFVSTIPARQLDALAERARRSNNLSEFERGMLGNSEYEAAFVQLCKPETWKSKATAWETLRTTWVRWPDERELQSINLTLSELVFDHENSQTIPAALAEFLLYHTGTTLDSALSREMLLAEYGLASRNPVENEHGLDRVSAITRSWTDGVDREMLHPSIARSESDAIADSVRGTGSENPRVSIVSGDAGSGKTAVLRQAAETIKDGDGAEVLAFRLDRLDLMSITTTRQLGNALDLSMSPVTALASVSAGKPCALIVDQLDAVSLVSGRATQALDVIADLLREALAYPQMGVILSCRSFDLSNDYRIRGLLPEGRASEVQVGQLKTSQVSSVLQTVGLSATSFSDRQMRLLALPLNLVLLSSVADESGVLQFETAKNLLDLYWIRKMRECHNVGVAGESFVRIAFGLASAMSDKQRLALPASQVREELRLDAEKLVSAHVLTFNDRKWAFFHESFFDYVFAKRWLQEEDGLTEFLLRGEQELFRRAQVRQVLVHLREDDLERFCDESKAILFSKDVRFHIKALVLAVLSNVPSPSGEEWRVLSEAMQNDEVLTSRVVRALRTPEWFLRLQEDGVLEAWLQGEEVDQNRAVDVLRTGVQSRPDLVAELLTPHRDDPSFDRWWSWLLPISDLSYSRDWFELVLDVLRNEPSSNSDGTRLWGAARKLPSSRPQWAVELLKVYLSESAAGTERDSGGRLRVLKSNEPLLSHLIQQATDAAPDAMREFLVPYVLNVASQTGYSSDARPISDAHFSFRIYGAQAHEVEDAVLAAFISCLQRVSDADSIPDLLELLRSDHHDVAQFGLYKLLQARPQEFSSTIAAILLEGEYRFECGYMSDAFWCTKELLEAVGDYLTDEELARIENALLAFRPHDDSDELDYGSFELLSGMPESRLSADAQQKLRDKRASLGRDEPAPPTGIMGGVVGSPIPLDRAREMSDDEWRVALVEYASDRGVAGSFQGGAIELARVVAELAKANPERFVPLLLELGTSINHEYIAATLRAFGEEDSAVSPDIVFNFVQQAAALQVPEIDRWLGFALRILVREDLPIPIVEVLSDRMRHSSNPAREGFDHGPEAAAIRSAGINSARGSLADFLGDVLLADEHGTRAAVVLPVVLEMADDPSIAVRSSVAHLIAGALRHDESMAVAALQKLVASDPAILAVGEVAQLVSFAAQIDYSSSKEIIEAMLSSGSAEVATNGGSIAGFLGIELDYVELFTRAASSTDSSVRTGVARICADRLDVARNRELASSTLAGYLNDEVESVREAAVRFVVNLRDRALRPHGSLLSTLVKSKAFTSAQSQLWITLERSTDAVSDLLLNACRSFVQVHGDEISDIATAASMEARHVCELVIRAYVDGQSQQDRAVALDLIDQLVRLGALDIDNLLVDAEH